jgi:hypothetical protein
MTAKYMSAKDITPGMSVVRITRSMDEVVVEIGRVTAVRRDSRTVAYKVYSQAWLDDSSVIACDASKQYLAPFTVTVHSKVRVAS